MVVIGAQELSSEHIHVEISEHDTVVILSNSGVLGINVNAKINVNVIFYCTAYKLTESILQRVDCRFGQSTGMCLTVSGSLQDSQTN